MSKTRDASARSSVEVLNRIMAVLVVADNQLAIRGNNNARTAEVLEYLAEYKNALSEQKALGELTQLP